MLYLDHAATTPLRPESIEAMAPYAAGVFGNSSGSHYISRRAKNALEEAREKAAGLIGAQPEEIVFTGGGTEADNLALVGTALESRGRVVTVATEHEAVLETARWLERLDCPLTVVEVDGRGRVDPEKVVAAVDEGGASVVSVMSVNNETGTIQPIEKIRALLGDRGTVLHTDAIQAYSSMEVTVGSVDLLSLAAHKFGGPQGVGLLFVRKGLRLAPLVSGGGQEMGRRSGTHNIAGIVGMVAAMEAAAVDRERFRRTTEAARDRFEEALADRAGRTVPALLTTPHHSHLSFEIPNEALLFHLDRLGLAASAGSACQSGAASVSHVLTAMGIPEEQARRSLRFSFGWTTQPEHGEQAAELVLAAIEASQ
ncbi:MAG: cysteine desulfurase family protein [Acidimicrobiia bacterium]